MQVNVVQASQVVFKKCRWWSDYIDICLFNYGYNTYLLQMRVNRINKKKFRCVSLAGYSGCTVPINDITNLTQMKK